MPNLKKRQEIESTLDNSSIQYLIKFLENIPCPAWIFDSNFEVIYSNSSLNDLMGTKLNGNLWQIFDESNRKTLYSCLNHAFKGQNSNAEFKIIRSDKKIKWLRSYFVTIGPSDSSEIIDSSVFVAGYVEDITNEKDVLPKLKKFQSEIKKDLGKNG